MPDIKELKWLGLVAVLLAIVLGMSQGNNVRAGDVAGGDLSGTYPNPVVAQVQQVAINCVAPTDGQILKYATGSSGYDCAADATGAGGGAVSNIFTVCSFDAGVATSTAACDYAGDGIADDVQLQAALSALPADGGCVVMVGGTFNIASALSLNTNDCLRGQGRATTLRASAGLTSGVLVSVAGANQVSLDHFTIDGNSIASLHGLHLVSSQEWLVRDLQLVNFAGTSSIAIRLEAQSTTNTGVNLFSGVLIDTAAIGLQLDGTSTAVVTLNYFYNTQMRSISGIGVRIAQWADNNLFYGTFVDLTANNTYGVIHNDSATPASSVGVYANQFWGLAIDSFGITGATGILYNATKQNIVSGYFHSPEVFNGTLLNDNVGRADSYFILNGQVDAATNQLEILYKNIDGFVASVTSTAPLVTTSGSAPSISLTLASVSGAATSSASGLEIRASGLGLLGGCADNEILKWATGGSLWACAADAVGAGGSGNSYGVINGDSGTANAATSTDTISIIGDASGIDTVATDASPDTVTISFDGSEVAADALGEAVINFVTVCASGNHLYVSGGNLACETDAQGVTSVTASAPVVSSGGATPNITLTQHAGTDVTADLEEEAQIGSTSVTGNVAAEQVLVGTSANALVYATLPNCPDSGGNHLNYATTTHVFSCGTTGGAGGSVPNQMLPFLGTGDANSGLSNWSAGGGGSTNAYGTTVAVDVNATSGSERGVRAELLNNINIPGFFDQNPQVSLIFNIDSITAIEWEIGMSNDNYPSATRKYIGVRGIDDDLYAVTSDGATRGTTLLCSACVTTGSHRLRFVFTSASDLEVFLDEVSQGTRSSNLPSGDLVGSTAWGLIWVKTTEAVAKTLTVTRGEVSWN